MSFEIRRALADVSAARAARVEARAAALTEYNNQLTAGPGYFDQQAVNAARAKVRRLDDGIAQDEERFAALQAQLPSAASAADAQRYAESELERANAAHRRFPAMATRFIEALLAAEAAGRELVALRAAATLAVGTVRDLAREFDLPIRAADAPALTEQETRLTTNVAAALVDLAAGDPPREFVEAYLTEARRQYERVSAAV